MKIKNLQNKNIAILGFGLEGKSSLVFLLKEGIKNITILDKTEKLKKDVVNFLNKKQIDNKNLIVIGGKRYLDYLGDFDIIIKSPGISPYNKKIINFKNKLTSQTQIFLENYKGKVIGITGTKGKSTISSLIYQILKSSSYKVKLVGNIGKPVLDEIDLKKDKYDFIIYELSSYMLEGFSPKLFIGLLNNIFLDHMNWHNNSFNIYKQAKENILKNAKYQIDGRKIKNTKVFETKLIGEHNQKNILVVKYVCDILKIKEKIFYNIIKSFKPLKHRLENIGTYKGIIFIDDAISTTPESTIEAIKTFNKKIGTIFLGGLDRGYNFTNLVKYLKLYHIKNIVLFPDSGLRIGKLLNNKFNILATKSMKKAIKFAFSYTKKGDICILSTASPSYNLWENYKEKGKEFKKEIEKQSILL